MDVGRTLNFWKDSGVEWVDFIKYPSIFTLLRRQELVGGRAILLLEMLDIWQRIKLEGLGKKVAVFIPFRFNELWHLGNKLCELYFFASGFKVKDRLGQKKNW